MDLSFFQSATAQVGFAAVLFGFMFWWIRAKNADCANERASFLVAIEAERQRNQNLTDKVIALAQSTERTAADITAAVKGRHP